MTNQTTSASRFAGVAVILLAVLYGTGCGRASRLGKTEQIDHNDLVASYIGECIEDSFYIHRKVPKSVRDITECIEKLEPDSRPSARAHISWKVLDKAAPDESNGGEISLVQIQVSDSGVTREDDYPVDFRDPDRVWKFHVCDLPNDVPNSRQRRARNLANGLALGIYRFHLANPDKAATWDDLSKVNSGWSDIDCLTAINEGARSQLTYRIRGDQILIGVVGTSTTFHYPLAGPKVYNAHL